MNQSGRLFLSTMKEIPSAIISFRIKNSVTGTPSTVLKTPGVVNKKLNVVRKVITERILPKNPAFFQKKESKRQIAAIISILPIIFETPYTEVILYNQLIRKLFLTKDSIPFASVGANLKLPIHNKTIASPITAMV